jgi:hypothetical protein
VIETIQTPRLLVATLRANTTLKRLGVKVHRGQAPGTASFPYIVFRPYGGNDLDVIGGEQTGIFSRWIVKAVGRIEQQSDDEQLESVALAMDTALKAVAGTSFPTSTPLIYCDGFFRESGIDTSYPASDNPKAQLRELGGIYAAYVQAL